MELLRELLARQHEQGWVDNDFLARLARDRNVPVYRLEGLVSFYTHFRRTPPAGRAVQVCRDVSCQMALGQPLLEQLRLAAAGLPVRFEPVSCLGRCDSAPALAIDDCPLAPWSLRDQPQILARLAGHQPAAPTGPPQPRADFKVDPYASGARPFGTVMDLAARGVDWRVHCCNLLKRAGLRGMGGAGFPTAAKWRAVADQHATPKYVICNADESEPGTFKDRAILAHLPHLVIEGMILAGLAVGARQGIVFLRHEYLPERAALDRAIDQARGAGVLGPNVAGTGMGFDVEIFVSPGGYILGEETALLEALEDKRGEPRNKPPYPVTHGLWGRPTVINNVETLALAASIMAHGEEWWQSAGVRGQAGLKFFSVSGDVNRPGVYEVPWGTTIAELLELAGGTPAGRPLKAVLPGGASSSFLPASAIDTPLTFEAIRDAGSMLGSGAVVAIGQGRNLFELATGLVAFFRNESCGKCVPCRIGTQRAVELLEGVAEGRVPAEALNGLPELGQTLALTSLCGLGQVALNPIVSMLRHFPEEVPHS